MTESIPDNTEVFWKKIEQKHGTKVITYSLMQYIPVKAKNAKEYIWGIGYITKKEFCFYHFPHQGWLGALMKIPPTKELYLEIPFDIIVSWMPPQKLPFLRKFFFNEKEYLTFITSTGTHVFIPDLRRKGIVDTLNTYIKEKMKNS